MLFINSSDIIVLELYVSKVNTKKVTIYCTLHFIYSSKTVYFPNAAAQVFMISSLITLSNFYHKTLKL